MRSARGRWSRGYVPHLDLDFAVQFVTWRTHDALSPNDLDRIRRSTEALPVREAKRQRYRLTERALDEGHGSVPLSGVGLASIVQEAILELHGDECELSAWCVMPNHVHVVLRCLDGHRLGDVIKLVKGRSSRRINAARRTDGRFWQPEYFDRVIRNEDHLAKVISYVHWNPVKAGLVRDPTVFAYSTANEAVVRRLKPAVRDAD